MKLKLFFLAGLLVLCAAFVFLNFHTAWSSTQFQKNVTRTCIGEGLPYAMQRRDKISLALVGEGPLVPALQRALMAELREAGLGDIELVQGLEAKYANPALIIKVSRPRLFWTPFYATSQLSVQAVYSSTGDTGFMGEAPASISNVNGPALRMFGEYQVSDRSWGMISRLGYHQILAEALVQQIVAVLKDLYQEL